MLYTKSAKINYDGPTSYGEAGRWFKDVNVVQEAPIECLDLILHCKLTVLRVVAIHYTT